MHITVYYLTQAREITRTYTNDGKWALDNTMRQEMIKKFTNLPKNHPQITLHNKIIQGQFYIDILTNFDLKF